MKWYKYGTGSRSWAFDDGYILIDKPDNLGLVESIEYPGGGFKYFTVGLPSSAHHALQDWGAALEAARDRFCVPVPVLFAMAAIESTRVKRDRSHMDPRSCREEPGYISDRKTPDKVSPGLMQTLLSTAQWMNEKFELYHDVHGDLEELTREDLFIGERSIQLGAAYMRYHISRKESDEEGFLDHDPILLCSAYNAGSVRSTTRNDFGLLTYGGNSRMEKFIAYHNDMQRIHMDGSHPGPVAYSFVRKTINPEYDVR